MQPVSEAGIPFYPSENIPLFLRERSLGSIDDLHPSGGEGGMFTARCSTCKVENESGIKFCGECGGGLALIFTEKRELKFVGR